MKRRIRAFALAIAARQARRNGDADLANKIERILANPEMLDIAIVVLEDEAPGGFLRDLLKHWTDNPGEFKAFIEWIITLFMSMASHE